MGKPGGPTEKTRWSRRQSTGRRGGAPWGKKGDERREKGEREKYSKKKWSRLSIRKKKESLKTFLARKREKVDRGGV